MMIALAALCLILCQACLMAERQGRAVLAGVAKTLASLCFIAVAIKMDALGSHVGRLILLGLALSLLGDVLLLWSQRLVFLGGMATFGLAHVAYTLGFLRMGPFPVWGWAAGVGATALFIGATLWWLWPRLLPQWRGAVAAYTAIIGIMVAVALSGTLPGRMAYSFGLGAVLFAVSDISVARDRLTANDGQTRRWGLPLYYAAQLILAASV